MSATCRIMHASLVPAIMLVAASLTSPCAMAAVPDASASLEALRQEIQNDPYNLDHYFQYAETAKAQQVFDEAENAYLKLLEVNPELDRVKLDLAHLYLLMGRNEAALQRFEEVLEGNPPQQVQENIALLMQQAKKQTQLSTFSGSATWGYNHDTNANSASSSGQLTVQDTTVNLPETSQGKTDSQMFLALGLNHAYKLGSWEDIKTTWYTKTSAYHAEQANVDTLDISVLGLRTGPGFTYEPWKASTSLEGGYNYIVLSREPYLASAFTEWKASYTPLPPLTLQYALMYEHRHFVNSRSVSTYTNRTGHAYQTGLDINFKATQLDVLTAGVQFRRESTRVQYYDNDQLTLKASYTHIFPEYNVFSNLSVSHRNSDYDGPDPLISATVREDNERKLTMLLGKQFEHGITATTSYQYKNVGSNLRNYDYVNHRVGATVGVKF